MQRDVTSYGIDFGTTNSVVAASRDPSSAEAVGLPHPSVVWYGPEGVQVGRKAKANINAYADQIGHRFFRSIKRHLGKSARFDAGGERLEAWEIAGQIFRHLRDDAIRTNNQWSIESAVVTVPVTFDGPARRDIRRAAGSAGIHVGTFVHEPFAAVVGYYAASGWSLDALPEERILVFDWGGGTLDITAVQTSASTIEELGTAGLRDVAGDVFDARIQNWAIDQFCRRYGLQPDAFVPARGERDRLAEVSEEAKKQLSVEERELIGVANLWEYEGRLLDLAEPLERGEFESLIQSDMSAAIGEVGRVLRATGLEVSDVDKVLLIGGSSEIPLLRREMQRLFGAKALPVRRSQTIIAEGAALISSGRYQPFLTRPVQVRLADGSDYAVFARGTLPSAEPPKTVTLFCTDNRDGEARLQLTEHVRGDGTGPSAQHTVLRVPVDDALPLPYNHERVYATFSFDADLVLNVSAHGASKQVISEAELHDLTFGLRFQ